MKEKAEMLNTREKRSLGRMPEKRESPMHGLITSMEHIG